jgi:hypothetical protein
MNSLLFKGFAAQCSVQVLFKGTVQRKQTWVKRGINRQLMVSSCSNGHFLNLKGLRTLKNVNVFSALRGTLLWSDQLM